MFSIETGCPPPLLFVIVSITNGIRARTYAVDRLFQTDQIHVAFKGGRTVRIVGFLDDQIDCLGLPDVRCWHA